jgi:hypothetical protein
MTYEKLLWYIWMYPETIYCPANTDCFAYAGDRIEGKRNTWKVVTDDSKNPIMVFKPSGTDGQCYTEDHDL